MKIKILLGVLLIFTTPFASIEQMVFTVGKDKKYHHDHCRYVETGRRRGTF